MDELDLVEARDRSLRAGVAAAAVSLGLLGWWVLRAPFVGLADNGDWGRYTCPIGLSGKVQFSRLPATLVRASCPSFDYRSTFSGFLRVFADVDTALFGAVHLSHLAVFWCVVVSAGWGWFTFELARATRRPGRSLATVICLIVVSSDVIFTSYFGSVYAEAMVVALLPALAGALVRLVRSDQLDRVTIAGTSVLLIAVTAAKPSLALTAPLFVGVVIIARRGRLQRVPVAIALAGAAALGLFSLTAIADPALTDWNTYNLAFTVVLPASDHPHAVLQDMGIDASNAAKLGPFIGIPFGPKVTDHWREPPLVAFREAGRPAVIRALATHPATWTVMVRRGIKEMAHLRLTYLANHVRPDRTGSSVPLAARPHPADSLLDLVAAAWWTLPIIWIGLAVWFVRRLWVTSGEHPCERAPAAIGLFAVLFAATQMLLALGDGYYELAKHLAIAGEATALTITGVLLAGAWHLADRYPRTGLVVSGFGNSPPRP